MKKITTRACKTRSVVESSIKKSVPSVFMATIDITRQFAYVVGGREYKTNNTVAPKGTTYYLDFNEAYKEFNQRRDEQIRAALAIKGNKKFIRN